MISKQSLVLLMVVLSAFSTPIMLSATNVALSTISRHFLLDAVVVSWIPMAYLMASAMFVLIFGRCADLFGRKKIFMIGIVTVIITSLVTAFSVNIAMLLIGRFFQGVSAAMLYATQMSMVTSVYPPENRGKAIGLVVTAVYFGLAAGPLFGGMILDSFGWRLALLTHIPVTLLAFFLGAFFVREEWKSETGSFDYTGSVLVFLSLACLCLAATNILSPLGAALILGFLLFSYLFFNHSLKFTSPIIDVRLFYENVMFSRSFCASLIMYTATYANVFLVSLYLQELRNLSPTDAGLIMSIQPVTMAIFSVVFGGMSDKIEPRILSSIGILLTFIALAILSNLTSASSLVAFVLALILAGLWFGLFASPNTNAIMSSVDKSDYGTASGAVATTRMLGQLTSMVLVAFLMSLVIGDQFIGASSLPLLEKLIKLSFGCAAVICIPGIILSLSRGEKKVVT